MPQKLMEPWLLLLLIVLLLIVLWLIWREPNVSSKGVVHLAQNNLVATTTMPDATGSPVVQLPLQLRQDLYWLQLQLLPTNATTVGSVVTAGTSPVVDATSGTVLLTSAGNDPGEVITDLTMNGVPAPIVTGPGPIVTSPAANSYSLALDSGSDLITIPNASCTTCVGSRWSGTFDPQQQQTSYQGGQRLNYHTATAYCPQLGQQLTVSIMSAGSTGGDNGATINLFGLLNSSVANRIICLDFPRGMMYLANSLSSFTTAGSTGWSSLQLLPYWAIPISGIPGVTSVILDTGSNYVLIDPSYQVPADFSFNVGNTTIVVPQQLIRPEAALVPGTIVLGNRVMRNYAWLFDLPGGRVAVTATN